MFTELQSVIGLFQNFILFVIIGAVTLLLVSMLALRKLSIGSSAISWYSIFLMKRKGSLFIVAILFLRMFYFISFLWMVTNISVIHFIVYFAMEAITIVLIFRWWYLLYDVILTAIHTVMIYLFSLLRTEINKVEIIHGMKFLYYAIAFLFVMSAICQFFISVTYLCDRTKERTEINRNILRTSFIMLAVIASTMILPIYMIKSIDYIYLKHGAYQVVDGVRVEYPKDSRISKEDTECMIETEDTSELLDHTPLYFNEESKLMITNTLCIVQPKLETTNRINKMNMISWNTSGYHINADDRTIDVDNFFLFDGKDTYYFPAGTVLTWEDHTFTAEEFCQVEVKYNTSVSIYDLKTNEYSKFTTGKCYCMATLKGKEQVNLSTDILYRKGDKEQMLFMQPSLLNDLE